MEQLDLKDRKILYHLDINSRQSFSKIGKKVGLHKDVVAYRVKKLIENGIIENFRIIINSSKLDYITYRFYIVFQYANPEIKKEIIDFFVESDYTNGVLALEGTYDLLVFLRAKNLPQIYSFWEKTLGKYRDYFADIVFSIYYQEHYYDLAFLLDDKPQRDIVRIGQKEDIVEIDALDRDILNLLSYDARMPTVDIANKLNSSVSTVNNRIKRLEKTGVIREFTVSIDFPKLGFHLYKVNLSLRAKANYSSIIKYVESIPNFFAIDKSLGFVDLELEFYLKDSNHLKKIMEDIEQKYPNDIKYYSYFKVLEIKKYCVFV